MSAVEQRSHGVGPLAFALTALSAVGLYAALRIGQVALFPQPNQADVLFDVHSGYFWRIGTSVYGAGLLAPLFYWLCTRRLQLASRALEVLVLGVAILVTAQALFFP